MTTRSSQWVKTHAAAAVAPASSTPKAAAGVVSGGIGRRCAMRQRGRVTNLLLRTHRSGKPLLPEARHDHRDAAGIAIGGHRSQSADGSRLPGTAPGCKRFDSYGDIRDRNLVRHAGDWFGGDSRLSAERHWLWRCRLPSEEKQTKAIHVQKNPTTRFFWQ